MPADCATTAPGPEIADDRLSLAGALVADTVLPSWSPDVGSDGVGSDTPRKELSTMLDVMEELRTVGPAGLFPWAEGSLGPNPFSARSRSCFSQYNCQHKECTISQHINKEGTHPYHPSPFGKSIIKIIGDIHIFIPPRLLFECIDVDIERSEVTIEAKAFYGVVGRGLRFRANTIFSSCVGYG